MVTCSCTKDKNSIKMLLLVLFAIQIQNTGHIFFITRVYYDFRPETCFPSPPVPKNRAAPVFSFYILFSNFPPENGAKTCSSTLSDIRYRLIRENVAHSCTGDIRCQMIEAMVWQYCSRVDYNCRFV